MKEEITLLSNGNGDFKAGVEHGTKTPEYGLTITMAIFFIVGEMAGSGILALPRLVISLPKKPFVRVNPLA